MNTSLMTSAELTALMRRFNRSMVTVLVATAVWMVNL
jgi:RecG-like helicase